MAFNVTYIIQAIDRFSKTAKKISASTEQLTRKFKKLSEAGEKFQKVSRGIFLKLALPMVGMGTAFLSTAAKFETMNVSFQTLLGSKEKGEAMFKSMILLSQRFGAATTLEFAARITHSMQSSRKISLADNLDFPPCSDMVSPLRISHNRAPPVRCTPPPAVFGGWGRRRMP